MTAYVPLYNDIVNDVLVTGLTNPARWAVPSPGKAGLIRLRYFPLMPTNSARAPFFSQLSVAGLSLRVNIGGIDNVLAYQDTWTKQTQPDTLGIQNYFYADLDLNTTELNTAVGSSGYYDTTFEIQLNDNGWRRTYQQSLRIINFVRDPTGAADLPDPAESYLTKAAAAGQYVSFANNPYGSSILLPSQDGSKATILYTDNDGVFHADPVG